jgi:hypothetical protein
MTWPDVWPWILVAAIYLAVDVATLFLVAMLGSRSREEVSRHGRT